MKYRPAILPGILRSSGKKEPLVTVVEATMKVAIAIVEVCQRAGAC